MKNYYCLWLLLAVLNVNAEVMWEDNLAIRSSTAIEWKACSAPTADGGVIYLWSDIHTGNRNIYAQKINHSGNPVWTTPLAVVAAEHAQFNPVIVPTSDHQFIIVYRDNRFDEQGDLYAQKLSADGQILWQAEGVPICTAVETSSNVIAVKDNFGGAFITWKDYRSEVVSIFAQHIDSSGNSLWTPDGICPASNDPKTVHSVIQDGGDGCLISYNNQVSGYGGEYVQRLGADGLPLWATPLSLGNDTDTMYEDDCRLALLNSNEFVATWWNSTGEQTDILTQRYNTAGQAVWAAPVSLNLPPADNVYLENTALADDGIFVAYYRVDGTTTALCLQKLSLSGQLLWNEQNTHCGTIDYIYYQNVSRIVPDQSGGCYIAWQEWNQETSDHNVRAQHISTAGVKTWAVEGVQLAQSELDQGIPTMELSAGRLFAGWSDYHTLSLGIYCQVLNPDGSFLLPEGGVQLYQGLNSLFFSNIRRTLARSTDIVEVWEDDRKGRSNSDTVIYLQGVNPDGSVDYAANGIPVSGGTEGFIYLLDAIALPDDDVVILWEDATLPWDTQLWMQRVDVTGNLLWGADGVQIAVTDAGVTKAMLSCDGDDIYVGWTAQYAALDVPYDRVWGQLVANGQPQWGATGMMIMEWNFSDYTRSFSLVGLQGRCYAWTERTLPGDTGEILTKLVNPDGSAAPGWFPVGNAVLNGSYSLTAGNYVNLLPCGHDWLVIWTDYQAGNGFYLKAQLMSHAGIRIWGLDGRVLEQESAPREGIQISINAESFAVLLIDSADPFGNLYAKAFDFDANLLWTSGALGQVTTNPQSQRIVSGQNGSYTVYWLTTGAAPGDMYIHYNYLSATGEVYNHAGGLLVSEAGDQINRHQISALNSDFYVTWTDGGSYRAEQCNVFIQKINNPYVTNQDELAPSAEISPVITAFPNPFRQNLSLQMKTNHAGTADISIYNLKGQKVRTLTADQLLSKGTHDFTWDGLDSSGTPTASGIYLLRSNLDGKISLNKLLKVK